MWLILSGINNARYMVLVATKLTCFRFKPIITLELLRKREFASHYVPGVFGPEELLKLFKKLLIVSPISEEEYLMPCLLPVADDPAVLSPSGSVPSLLLYFPKVL